MLPEKKDIEKDIDWYKRLLSLGVASDLIKESGVASSYYKDLYLKISPIGNLAIWITRPWQLSLLSGDMAFYDQIIPDLMQQKKHTINIRLANHAAWSGNPAALEYIKDKEPQLLDNKDQKDRTIAHYAVLSGDYATLAWVNVNKPGFLEATAQDGLTIAHYAILAGNFAALDWIKVNKPRLLDSKDDFGLTIAHTAATSNNPAALAWVNANKPMLLDAKDKYGLSITHHAVLSGNPAQFNYSLELSANPSRFIIPNNLPQDLLWKMLGCFKSVCQALDNNFTLTSIDIPKGIDEDILRESEIDLQINSINSKLERNKKIQKAIKEFTVLLQGQYQEQHPLATLPIGVFKQILASNLPENIPDLVVSQLYDKAYEAVNPEMRKIALQKKNLCKRIDKELLRLKSSTGIAVLLGFVESGNKKISALKTLSTLIENHRVTDYEPLTEKVSQWQKENQKLIDHQRNKIDAFFRPMHKTSTRKLMEEINGMLKEGDGVSSSAAPKF